MTTQPENDTNLPEISYPIVYQDLLKVREMKNPTLKMGQFIKPEIKPRNYQVVGILHMLLLTRMLLGDDCGLGKTLTCIYTYAHLLEKYPTMKLLVVSPKSATSQWVDEFSKFSTGIKVSRLENKGKDSRIAQYKQFWTDPEANVLVMHYHWVRSDYELFEGYLSQNFMVVFDEAAIFKNHQSEIHRRSRDISLKAKRAYGVTATPLKNSLLDGYGIYRVIHPTLFKNMTQFKKTYCVEVPMWIGHRKINKITGYINTEHFRQCIDPFFLGRKRHDVATDLPPLITKEVRCEMTDVQRDLYKRATEGYLGTDGKELTSLTKMIYYQQIVDSPHLLGVEGESGKEQELLRLLDEDLRDQKVIIFSRFKTMINRLTEILPIPSLRITGDETENQRELSKLLFQEDEDALKRWIVANKDKKSVMSECKHLIKLMKDGVYPKIIMLTPAGSESINLQKSSTFIFYDNPWTYGDYEQLIGRMLRIGSTHSSVLAIHLVCPKTIDDYVIKTLISKGNIITSALGPQTEGALDFTSRSMDDLCRSVTQMYQ